MAAATLAALVVVPALTGACGGGNAATPAAGQAAVLLAATRARAIAARTATFTESIGETQTATPQALEIDGALDLPGKRIDMTFSGTGVSGFQAVLDGSVIYEKIPQLAASLAGRPWLKIDPSTLRNLTTTNQAATTMLTTVESLLKHVESQDPTQGLALLAGVTGTVTAVGKETVRGTATTHYAFTIDTGSALANAPADAKAAVQLFVSQLGPRFSTGAAGTLPAEAWVDAGGLLRRLHLVAGAGGAATTDMTMELFGYGSPVSITAPPPDQATDFGALISQLGSGG